MITLSIYPREKSIYPNFYYRLIVCLVIAHFIVSFGEEPNFFQLICLPNYYPALAGSLGITVVLSEFIYLMHQHFENNFSWRNQIKTRMIVQIVCGFIISSMLAIFLAMIYFKLNGISIWNAGYFRYDFTVVLCFIALVNSFYVILSLFQLKLLPSRRNHSNARISSQEQIKKDIPAIIFSEQKHNFALQFDAHKFNWPKSLKATMGDLPLEDYFQINRGTIIHYNIISHYRPLTSDTLKLVLKAPFEDIYYVVSQRNAVDFKRWFDGGNDLTVNA